MPPDDCYYPVAWLRIAEKDLGRMQLLLTAQDPEAAGFSLQQAVEKFLKGFLLSKGWQLQRIHDLEVLLNRALSYTAGIEPYRAVCQKITTFYLLERYPSLTESGLTVEDIREPLEQVGGLIEKLRQETARG